MINPDLLLAWGGLQKRYKKGETIFEEGDEVRYYFQLLEGKIKMYNILDDGKEFTQGIMSKNESFGEPPLFINEKYPSNCKTIESSVIIKLKKETFLQILDEYREIEKAFLKLLAKRSYKKSLITKTINNNHPKERILFFLKDYKSSLSTNENTLIPYTRKEIAEFTGLRVEPIIRTLKSMEKENIINIKNRKLYY